MFMKMSGGILPVLTMCLLAMAHSKLWYAPSSLSSENTFGTIEDKDALQERDYNVLIENKKETCHDKYRLLAKPNQDQEKCQVLCDNESQCMFFYINVGRWCALYQKCEEKRIPAHIGTTYQKNNADWSLVFEKKECRGSEVDKGYMKNVNQCAAECKGLSSMFIFGTNDFGNRRCDRYGSCKCYCETAATSDGTCSVVHHGGYRLYKYKNVGPGTGTTIDCSPPFSEITVAKTKITSPNYPSNYGNGLDCQTTIRFQSNESVSLYFRAFNTESYHDWLEVRDGDRANSRLIGSRLYGSDIPNNIRSTGNSMTLVFHTDDTETRGGFEVEVDVSTGGTCVDSDNGKTDVDGDSCSNYTYVDCDGRYDDDDFKSAEMCCICGGGLRSGTSCLPRTKSQVCPRLKDRVECLTSTEARKGVIPGVGELKGTDCVWCPYGRCTDDNQNRCEPKNWLISVGGTFEECATTELQNAGMDCLSNCNGFQGHCPWCGTKGVCCRKGVSDINGCDGVIGGQTRHECVSHIPREYEAGFFGEAGCGDEEREVPEDECKKILNGLGFDCSGNMFYTVYEISDGYANLPHGCFVGHAHNNWKHCYYNKHPGTKNTEFKSICRKDCFDIDNDCHRDLCVDNEKKYKDWYDHGKLVADAYGKKCRKTCNYCGK